MIQSKERLKFGDTRLYLLSSEQLYTVVMGVLHEVRHPPSTFSERENISNTEHLPVTGDLTFELYLV
jgi:hypothetical protein